MLCFSCGVSCDGAASGACSSCGACVSYDDALIYDASHACYGDVLHDDWNDGVSYDGYGVVRYGDDASLPCIRPTFPFEEENIHPCDILSILRGLVLANQRRR